MAQRSLTRAFTTFTQAAGSLEKSYLQLQGEVARLHQELRRANAELEKTLEENARVRTYLARVLESLPCGILVVNGEGRTQIINPEARRLLGVSSGWSPDEQNPLPAGLQKLFDKVPANSFFSEREWAAPETPSHRSIGILRANVSEASDGAGDTILILRDISEQQRVASERESAQRSRALAEVAAVLAHEIRNPLGSMELFAGLLSDATAQMPETRQWVNHLQAGLRALSSTQKRRGEMHAAERYRVGALFTVGGKTVEHSVSFARCFQQRNKQYVGIAKCAGIQALGKTHDLDTRSAAGGVLIHPGAIRGRRERRRGRGSKTHGFVFFTILSVRIELSSRRNSGFPRSALAIFSGSTPQMFSLSIFQAPTSQPFCSLVTRTT
jgi:hypothetical protein